MTFFLLGLAALALGVLLLRGFANANIAVLGQQIRVVGGIAALTAAAGLMLRGAMSYAMPLAMLGMWLLAGRGLPLGQTQKSQGQASRIVTDHLEMELDHDTGSMQGRVLKGEFAGRALETMSPAEMARLWQQCRFNDVQSATLIEAYLDSVHPSWREDMNGSGQRADGNERPRSGAVMTREEALDVLGLEPGATEAEIRRAHRELMLKMHPDRGGSDYLAAKINLAKDILLGE